MRRLAPSSGSETRRTSRAWEGLAETVVRLLLGGSYCSVPLDEAALIEALKPFRRPLFTLGREPLQHLAEIPPEQFWTLRALEACAGNERCEVIGALGPFHIEDERALFERCRIDVLVSKNSGSVATEPKLDVARERGVPVVVLKRPTLPAVDREFTQAGLLLAKIKDCL